MPHAFGSRHSLISKINGSDVIKIIFFCRFGFFDKDVMVGCMSSSMTTFYESTRSNTDVA